MPRDSAFFVVSLISRTRMVTFFVPNAMVTISPTLTSYDALADLPLTEIRAASHASLATVRRFIKRETFRNLSKRIYYSFTESLSTFDAEKEGFLEAGIVIASPVWGLRPSLAATSLTSKVPKPIS